MGYENFSKSVIGYETFQVCDSCLLALPFCQKLFQYTTLICKESHSITLSLDCIPPPFLVDICFNILFQEGIYITQAWTDNLFSSVFVGRNAYNFTTCRTAQITDGL